MALKIWKPRCLLRESEKMMESMAAGVVQQTKRMTMEMRTRTSILSSGLWSERRREVRDICRSSAGGGTGAGQRAVLSSVSRVARLQARSEQVAVLGCGWYCSE